ncbi:MAG: GNAT family N-acetyltransferase, partial [Lachnospiraceae bacterium]|nr:GNAT family N-acetyltransferase [Lachnospiraceae bacterium]
ESSTESGQVEQDDRLNIQSLGINYDVRRITEEDISDVYRLCKTNKRYYRYMRSVPTRESLTEIISRIPGDAGNCGKYFVGFYDLDRLVAVMDLITGYPEEDAAFIGWLMVDGALQGQGIGSQILADVRAAMKAQGYDKLSLGCVKENVEAIAFWEGQGFTATKEEQVEQAVPGKDAGRVHTVVTMMRKI